MSGERPKQIGGCGMHDVSPEPLVIKCYHHIIVFILSDTVALDMPLGTPSPTPQYTRGTVNVNRKSNYPERPFFHPDCLN